MLPSSQSSRAGGGPGRWVPGRGGSGEMGEIASPRARDSFKSLVSVRRTGVFLPQKVVLNTPVARAVTVSFMLVDIVINYSARLSTRQARAEYRCILRLIGWEGPSRLRDLLARDSATRSDSDQRQQDWHDFIVLISNQNWRY